MRSKQWLNLWLVLSLALLSAQGLAREDADRFSGGELDQLLAPVALYPDALLSQILMAATYPLEVVEAARWSSASRPQGAGGGGAAVVDLVVDRDWDPSVKALVAFPDVLARLDENLEWTRALGDAYLLQEEEVIDAIQRLRDEAYVAGYFEDLQHTRAYRDRTLVVIEPFHADMIHVPYYHPRTVYSRWWQPYHRSFRWAPPRGIDHHAAVYWGGVPASPALFFSTFHWHQRHIVIVDRSLRGPRFIHGDGVRWFDDSRRWRHDPRHRRGLGYAHPMTREAYRYSTPSREDFILPRRPENRVWDGRNSVPRDGGDSGSQNSPEEGRARNDQSHWQRQGQGRHRLAASGGPWVPHLAGYRSSQRALPAVSIPTWPSTASDRVARQRLGRPSASMRQFSTGASSMGRADSYRSFQHRVPDQRLSPPASGARQLPRRMQRAAAGH